MKRILSPVASAALVAALSLTTAANAFEWSDNFIGYRTGTTYREPANSKDISKDIIQFQHVDGYKYGSNFLNIDYLKSDGNDKEDGGPDGAEEVYVVYRHTLSLSKVTGKSFKSGIIRDYGFVTGFDVNYKNDTFSPAVRELWVGPSVDFEVPGFFSLGLMLDKEYNNNSIVNKHVEFDATWALCAAWGINFKLGLPVVFKGFSSYIGPKGKDGFGADTEAEWLTEAALMFDVGSTFGKKGTFYVGPGYQYWKNKFGNDSSADSTGGCTASVFQLQAEVHF
jgi:nucleoside-specific outer membrane channel protein Tsx